MLKSTLVVMAAGIGSRYGGIKQLEPVGPSGEIIVDYSVYDAIQAGFTKVVFIIRRDLEKDFKEIVGNKIAKHIEVEYVFQEIDNLPGGYKKPEGREKPWGTGQAVLSCKGVVKGPFMVINADDYYGKEAFVKVKEYLEMDKPASEKMQFCMAGFQLGNTLSENGAVTRGICKVDQQGMLLQIEETSGIIKTEDGAAVFDEDKNQINIAANTPVSMNMLGFTPEFIDCLEERFVDFLAKKGTEMKSEFLVPIIVDEMIQEGKAEVKVLETKDIWFGVTYKEDREYVSNSIKELVNKGEYPNRLFD